MSVAALTLVKCTGADAGTETDVSDKIIAVFNEDSANVDVDNHAIAAPEKSGDPENNSYECIVKWRLTSAPDFYVRNVGVYGSSSQPATGYTIYMGTLANGISNAHYTGSGSSDDMTTSGTYSGSTNDIFYVEIVAGDPSSPNTFRWKKGSGSWSSAVNCAITATLLQEGISITFGSTTGHTTSDTWEFGAIYLKTPVVTKSIVATLAQHLNYISSGSALILEENTPDGKLEVAGGSGTGEETWYLYIQAGVAYGSTQGSIDIVYNVTYEEA